MSAPNNGIPPEMQLTPADYSTLLDMLDNTPTKGTQNMRHFLNLEAKLLLAAKALTMPQIREPAPVGDTGSPEQPPND